MTSRLGVVVVQTTFCTGRKTQTVVCMRISKNFRLSVIDILLIFAMGAIAYRSSWALMIVEEKLLASPHVVLTHNCERSELSLYQCICVRSQTYPLALPRTKSGLGILQMNCRCEIYLYCRVDLVNIWCLRARLFANVELLRSGEHIGTVSCFNINSQV